MLTIKSFLEEVLLPPEVYGLDLQLELHQTLYPKSYKFLEVASSLSNLSKTLIRNDTFLESIREARSLINGITFVQHQHPNSFSFDGINGSGKSTLIEAVAFLLTTQTISVSITSSHVTRPYILSALLKQVGVNLSNYPIAQFLIRLADAAFLEIYQASSKSDIALFDRFIPSIIASEAANLKHNFKCHLETSVQELSLLTDLAFLVPHSFTLSVPIDVAIHRREKARHKAFSDLELLSAVQTALGVYCEIKGLQVIDGTLPVNQLKTLVLNQIAFPKSMGRLNL